jgi:ketopantoate reductase
LGCYFAAVLARSDTKVALFARGGTLRAIPANGIVLEGLSGNCSARPEVVTDDIESIGAFSHVLFAPDPPLST